MYFGLLITKKIIIWRISQSTPEFSRFFVLYVTLKSSTMILFSNFTLWKSWYWSLFERFFQKTTFSLIWQPLFEVMSFLFFKINFFVLKDFCLKAKEAKQVVPNRTSWLIYIRASASSREQHSQFRDQHSAKTTLVKNSVQTTA